MHLFIFVFFALFSFVCSASLESRSSTFYILLGVKENAADNECFNNELKNYIQSKIVFSEAHLSCHTFALSDDFSRVTQTFSEPENSIFWKAKLKWFNESSDENLLYWKTHNPQKNLKDLLVENPQIVPLQYIIIAEGASGLFVREYIQGASYQGNIANVLFFNTPHEGSGFADNALFSTTNILDNSKSTSDYSMMITLSSIIYLLDGDANLQEFILPFVQNAIMGLVSNAENDAKKMLTELYKGYDIKSPIVWYLTQDASVYDEKYRELINAAEFDVEELLGKTQILNSLSNKTSFKHPNYNINFSQGLPSIGNARRTFSDYLEQSKKRVSDEILSNFSSEELKLLGDLKKLKFNKDDLTGSVQNIISFLKNYIPEEYMDALNSSFLNKFSPEVLSLAKNVADCSISESNIKACARKGINTAAKGLANYSLNFFDEGTFDVPRFSAIGENVKAFKESIPTRFEYDFNDITENYGEKFSELKNYQKTLDEIGRFEKNREIVSASFKTTCAFVPQLELLCKTADFALNIGMMLEASSKNIKLLKQSAALQKTKEASLWAVWNDLDTIAIRSFDGTLKDTVFYSKIEEQIFSPPQISIASTRKNENGTIKIAPQFFFKENGSYEILNYTDDFVEVDLRNATKNLTIKDVLYNGEGVALNKQIRYSIANPIFTKNPIQKFEFQIDDHEPDSLQWIKFDFNTRVQLAFERIKDKWYLHYGVSYHYQNLGELEKSPITAEGFFYLSLDEILEKYGRQLNTSLAAFYDDGNNFIQIALMNKIGNQNNVRFAFYYQATDLLFDEAWPKSLETVSALDEVVAYLNDNAYPIDITSAQLKIKSLNDSFLDSIEATIESLESSNGNRYKLSANLKPIWERQTLKNDEFLLEWELKYSTIQQQAEATQNLKSFVYVDTQTPQYKMELSEKIVAPNDLLLGYIQSEDSVYQRGVRYLRALVINENLTDTIVAFSKVNDANEYTEIRLNDTLPQNFDRIVYIEFQAFDNAFPNKQLRDEILNSNRENVWNIVLDSSGKLVKGINGIILKDSIWVDREAPQLAPNSLHITKEELSLNTSFPQHNKQHDKFILNNNERLKIDFDFTENLMGRDSIEIDIEIVFEDSILKQRKKYFNKQFYKGETSTFHFDEPLQNSLRDGSYKVFIELKDEAKNIHQVAFENEIIIDRTPPVIEGIFSGVVYESRENIDSTTAYISQMRDITANISNIDCYGQITTEKINTPWFLVASLPAKDIKQKIVYDIKANSQNLKKGRWINKILCYDVAGNYSESLDFFDVGERTPEITYPNSNTVLINANNLLIKGIAVNPIIKNGNDNLAEFKIEYQKNGDSLWSDSQIKYLTHEVHSTEQNLAILNLEPLEKGDYNLKLSVRGCSSEELCPWVSTQQQIGVLESESSTKLPYFDVELPTNPKIDFADTISIALKGETLNSNWVVQSKMFVQNPKNKMEFILAQSKHFEPMEISPFGVEPALKKDGLSIWQEADGLWNLEWRGRALADSLIPQMRLKYLYSHLQFVNNIAAKIDTIPAVGSLQIKALKLPAHNRIANFDLSRLDSFKVQFYTDSAFVIDLSALDSTTKIYTNAKTYSYRDPEFFNGVFYIYPQKYKAKISFDGLTQTGLYPSGGTVKMTLLAYDKNEPSHLITSDYEWEMSNENKPVLVKGVEGTGEFFVAIGNENHEISKQNLGYQFGLKGKAAFVSATVLDPNGNIVKKLLTNQWLAAGSSNDAYTLSWNGITEENFLKTEVGTYKIQITACSEIDGAVESVLEYPFDLKYAGNLLEAPSGVENAVEFSMDEAKLDSSGHLRFVGNLDYLMKVNASAKFLPENERSFSYKWDWKEGEEGKQFPTFYKKYNYSLGIHRHRDEIPVTVAVLLATNGHNLNRQLFWGCDPSANKIPYRIFIIPKVFNQYDLNGSLISLKLNSSFNVVGYDKNNSKKDHYPIVMEVKIYSSDALTKIKEQFDFVHEGELFTINGTADEDLGEKKGDNIWDYFFDQTSYKKTSLLNAWFNDFSEAALWQGRVTFNSFEPSQSFQVLDNTLGLNTSCTPADSICGLELPEQEDSSSLMSLNVHKNMMTVVAEHFYKDAFTDNTYEPNEACSEHSGAGREVGVNLRLKVNDDYWEPAWGTNNLANRYVRFSPTNKILYDNGYFSNIESKNYYDGKQWKHSSDDGYITAFEVQSYFMKQNTSNPLFFADEVKNTEPVSVPSPVYSSTFDVQFFTANDDVEFKVLIKDSSDNIRNEFYSGNSVGFVNQRITNEPLKNSTGINPLDIEFHVAAHVSASEGFITDSNFQIKYPYLGDLNALQLPTNERFDNYRFYPDNRAQIHRGLNDWDLEYWKSLFVNSEGKIKNPMFDTSYKASTLTENLSTQNLLDSVYIFKISPQYTENDFWIIPQDSIQTISLDQGAKGSFNLINADSNSWNINFSNSAWRIVNQGVQAKTLMPYIFSKDSNVNSSPGNVEHFISLSQLNAQNPNDSLFTSDWYIQKNIDSVALFRRDSTQQYHNYLQVEKTADTLFHITPKTSAVFDSRIDEIATLRGRVPGENIPWKLSYTKNGMLFPLDSGIQEASTDSLPILNYLNLNKLQGNTSFFLTYGKNGATYFKQLDVHIGNLITANGGSVQSMYGNVSVNFPEGAWEDSVDVTVRIISNRDYNFNAFKNLDITGPLIEVLPSHNFTADNTKWPQVQMKILRESIGNTDPSALKIYKPNFDTQEIIPLETEVLDFFDSANWRVSVNENWSYALLSAKTQSFSTFFAMDSSVAKNIQRLDTLSHEKTELVCGEIEADTLWAGTFNGYLEIPYPCFGKSNFLIQLRADSNIVLEHQGVSKNPIIWNLKNIELSQKINPYTSRIIFYGMNDEIIQKLGPLVFIDSISPEILDAHLEIHEEHNNKILQLDALAKDIQSGIFKTKFDLYFAGNLVETRTIFNDSIFAENFILNRKLLYSCMGCAATIEITTEDKGHNFSKIKIQTEKLYPYPSALALWYPLSDGAGSFAKEVLTANDLEFINVSKAWNKGAYFNLNKETDFAQSKNALNGEFENKQNFSLEFNFKSGNMVKKQPYSLIGFGNSGINFGIESSNKYFIENKNERQTFNITRKSSVFEHFALVFENKKVSIYKNGEFIESLNFNTDFTLSQNTKISLGKFEDKKSAVGALKNLRLYTSALTAEQVRDLYKENLDLDEAEIFVARAADLPHENLTLDQSCDVPGRAFRRQKNGYNEGKLLWEVETNAGAYTLYLLRKNYILERSQVEVFVDGNSRGIFDLTSSGIWESESVTRLNLNSSSHTIELRPLGNLGIAGIALIKSEAEISAEEVPYGAGDWQVPTPKIAVKMQYENSNDFSWIKPKFQIQNLTDENILNAKLRYYYRGEGGNVQALAFYPGSPMRLEPESENIFFGEFMFTEPIPARGSPYFGNGPQIGFHRNDYYFPWNMYDDPSYSKNAEREWVNAIGVAILDAEGELLNEWVCYDSEGPAVEPKINVRAVAKNAKVNSSQSALISMYVENVGATPLEGFETRYYFRDTLLNYTIDFYNVPFATYSVINVGGNLNYISFVYNNTVLNPNEKSDFGEGVLFEMHKMDWSNTFDISNDPSGKNLTEIFEIADSILILDTKGNLLWGSVPTPTFSNEYNFSKNIKDLVSREGNLIFVDIEETDFYTLEAVNAIGTPLTEFYNGLWEAGVHFIDISNFTITQGSYLVLRKGSEILSWKLLN